MLKRNETDVEAAEASAEQRSPVVAAFVGIHWGKVIWDTARGLLIGIILMMLKGDA